MMVGGISGLLLQMLHPAVLAGVWDHSSFRADLHGRLRRTARFIAVTTYGRKSDAEAAIARVRQIHELVCGVLPNGVPYAASNPALLAWVHVTETTSFLNARIRYAEPRMSDVDQDRYFDENGAHCRRARGRSYPKEQVRGATPDRGDAAAARGQCAHSSGRPARVDSTCAEQDGGACASARDAGRNRLATGVGTADARAA
jgi:hypothetical protein